MLKWCAARPEGHEVLLLAPVCTGVDPEAINGAGVAAATRWRAIGLAIDGGLAARHAARFGSKARQHAFRRGVRAIRDFFAGTGAVIRLAQSALASL